MSKNFFFDENINKDIEMSKWLGRQIEEGKIKDQIDARNELRKKFGIVKQWIITLHFNYNNISYPKSYIKKENTKYKRKVFNSHISLVYDFLFCDDLFFNDIIKLKNNRDLQVYALKNKLDPKRLIDFFYLYNQMKSNEDRNIDSFNRKKIIEFYTKAFIDIKTISRKYCVSEDIIKNILKNKLIDENEFLNRRKKLSQKIYTAFKKFMKANKIDANVLENSDIMNIIAYKLSNKLRLKKYIVLYYIIYNLKYKKTNNQG